MKTSFRNLQNLFKLAIAIAVVLGVTGCAGSSSSSSGSGGGGGGTTPGSGATYVYTVQQPSSGAGSILQFTAGANGSVSPLGTLTTPANSQTYAVATDASGQIYVSLSLNSGAAVIEVFAAGATGAATPVRTITLPVPYPPNSMVVDASGVLYAVDDDGRLAVYSSTASGTAAPTRLITGALTQLVGPLGVTVDTAGNVYVSEEVFGTTTTGSILVFSPTANGNVAPTRTITNSSLFFGVAIDASGNLFANLDTTATPSSASIVEFSATASGAATPVKTIAGTSTGLTTAGGLRIDSAGNMYLPVETLSGSTFAFSLVKFTSAATGNVAPAAVMTSTAWNSAGSEIAIR